MLLERELREDLERAVLHPRGMVGLDARPRPAAARLHLAALQGERDVVAAGIAGDELHLRAEDAVDRFRERYRCRSCRRCRRRTPRARSRSSKRVMPVLPHDDANAHFVVGAAEPAELGRLELRASCSPNSGSKAIARPMVPKALPSRGAACRASWRGASCRRLPCSRGTTVGLPGRWRAMWRREQPGVDVVAAADAVADVRGRRCAAGADTSAAAARKGRQEREGRDRALLQEARDRRVDGHPDASPAPCARAVELDDFHARQHRASGSRHARRDDAATSCPVM